MEENLVKQHSFNQRKYEVLAAEAAQKGWRFEKLIVEVGARGFVPSHVRKTLSTGRDEARSAHRSYFSTSRQV